MVFYIHTCQQVNSRSLLILKNLGFTLIQDAFGVRDVSIRCLGILTTLIGCDVFADPVLTALFVSMLAKLYRS